MSSRNSSNETSMRKIAWNNFVGGLFWGVGSALGAALLVTVLGVILTKVNVVPLVGTFVSEVNSFAAKHKAFNPQ